MTQKLFLAGLLAFATGAQAAEPLLHCLNWKGTGLHGALVYRDGDTLRVNGADSTGTQLAHTLRIGEKGEYTSYEVKFPMKTAKDTPLCQFEGNPLRVMFCNGTDVPITFRTVSGYEVGATLVSAYFMTALHGDDDHLKGATMSVFAQRRVTNATWVSGRETRDFVGGCERE